MSSIARSNSWLSDVAIAMFVIAIAVLLLIPLPTALLDLLLVINFAFSILLLVAGLYMPNALALLSFPAILLLTTLFRLGLNVASTRLILSQADAGQVIEAFGSFLTSGEIVVGVIIFLIITIVNFVVIARGAGRISEVAARFALDALPGKQMAIDSELKAGLISPLEAQTRRSELRKESQLYGSMDGAMKFVQGDAIAGFFIILTNIVGGLYMGISKGMGVGQALNTYTTLTVGDGLVSQIPALLVAICAGIVVTRVASDERSTLGQDVGLELFRKPAALFFSGGLTVLLSLFPAVPTLPFLTIGLVFLLGGFFLTRLRTKGAARAGSVQGVEFGGVSRGETLLESSSPLGIGDETRVVLSLDEVAFFPAARGRLESLSQFWEGLRTLGQERLGVALPKLTVQSGANLNPGCVEIRFRGSLVESLELPLDALFVETPPEQVVPLGFSLRESAPHPIDRSACSWISASTSAQENFSAAGIRTYDFAEFSMLRAVSFFLKNPGELVTTAAVFQRLQEIERQTPGLFETSVDTRFITPTRLAEIIQELVRQGFSAGDFRGIVENAAAYCSSCEPSVIKANEFDIEDAVQFFRSQRRRELMGVIQNSRGVVRYIAMSSETEELLARYGKSEIRAVVAEGQGPLLESRRALESIVSLSSSGDARVPAVLCDPDLLFRLTLINDLWGLSLPILSTEEVLPRVETFRVGTW